MMNKPFPIWCERCAKQDKCHIADSIPKCYKSKTEVQTERYYKEEDVVRTIDNVKNGYGMSKTAEEIIADLPLTQIEQIEGENDENR